MKNLLHLRYISRSILVNKTAFDLREKNENRDITIKNWSNLA